MPAQPAEEKTVAMLKLADLRKTTRRSGADGLRTVYPRFLRDRALAPRIELAIRYLEGMLGQTRAELDQEVVVQLFGDHKLARCIVACLATSYRHRARTFAEVLAADQVALLDEHGLRTSSDLRLWLFGRANVELHGFVGGPERAPFLRAAGEVLGLTPEQIETLATLDAPANAVLVRTGPVPVADDVIARFNYETVAALLANAPLIRLSLQRAPADSAAVRALCKQADVRADLAGRELTLHGRQDALDGWARHGARLVRLLSTLLVSGLPARSGEATIAAPTGGEWHFRLDAETLSYLGASATGAGTGYEALAVLEAWQSLDALLADYGGLRRAGGADGWVLRRAIEPVITPGAMVPALLTATRGTQRVSLLVAPATDTGAQAIASLSGRLPLIVLEVGTVAGAVEADGAGPLRLQYRERGDIAALPHLLAQAVDGAERRADVARLEAALEAVCADGVLTEARLAQRLSCAEDDVAARLALPAAQAARAARGIRYVEGFGLCSAEVLSRARAAAADVASLRGTQPAGAAWTARVLGRKLREVTGASEGIECLIAFLGAA